ncbi:DUF4259 domain-containing protein [Streptomyces sp. NPDC012600]|uniref:DUF4259 domain-containing protein n=1 Tax=Kitasatospora albolonga TaxID=68173 RepID=A0ABC8BVM8_9ACTN|nr:hypothetical protein B7C62_20730 [Kitasatospora albolonga]
MGTWGHKPFENDTAADFAGDLDGALQSERVEMLRATLASVANDASSHVDGGSAEMAIAAAALVAWRTEGGGEFQSEVCGPSCDIPDIPKEVISLAVDAVSRLLVKDNDLWDDRSQEGDGEEWLAMLQRLRSTLSKESTTPQESLW